MASKTSVLFRTLGRPLTFATVLLFAAPALAHWDGKRVSGEAPRHFSAAQSAERPWAGRPAAGLQLADKWQGKDKDKGGKERGDGDRRRYESLSPEERDRLRERRELFKSLPPEERERIERAREKYRNLPPERREELKDKWRNMSPEQRREYHRKMEKDDRSRNYR